MVDFEITVLDDRPEMTIPSGFPEASRIICSSLPQAFQSIKITPDTYIVIATQGHRTDMEALRCCIGSDAAYIGVIGSKRKIALMKQKFMDERWATAEEWNFVHTPVGIEIHSRSVNEIAISIVAELVKERYEINFLRNKKNVSSVVLAAGKSTRMGQQKLLMPYKGHSMVDHLLQKITNTNTFSTIVVTGSDSSRIEKELKSARAIIVYNERFEEGMLSSVQKGIAALGIESAGFLILLGDQPMVAEKVINRLIALFQKTPKGLLVPTFLGKRGHPVLIDTKFRDEIGKLSQAIGLRELFLNHPEDVLEVEIESDAILKDIDTIEDYRRETEE
jgi:molybdenum cofactor cytidylyltransferase